MNYMINTLDDLELFAKELLQHCVQWNKQNPDHACVVALSGDLGAGKTTLTQYLAKELGVIDQVHSPTFVIKKIYSTHHPVFLDLIHMDAYRLEDEQNIDYLRLTDDFSKSTNLIVIEWPSLISLHIPKDRINVILEHSPTTRNATIDIIKDIQ